MERKTHRQRERDGKEKEKKCKGIRNNQESCQIREKGERVAERNKKRNNKMKTRTCLEHGESV